MYVYTYIYTYNNDTLFNKSHLMRTQRLEDGSWFALLWPLRFRSHRGAVAERPGPARVGRQVFSNTQNNQLLNKQTQYTIMQQINRYAATRKRSKTTQSIWQALYLSRHRFQAIKTITKKQISLSVLGLCSKETRQSINTKQYNHLCAVKKQYNQQETNNLSKQFLSVLGFEQYKQQPMINRQYTTTRYQSRPTNNSKQARQAQQCIV